MKYSEFEDVISIDRMRRYVNACDGDKRKGMALYRYNLSLSSEMLKIISCFEVALRNRIDRAMELFWGNDWLRDSCLPGGIFDNPKTLATQKIIGRAYNELKIKGKYSPNKLLAEMEFGIWKYMYSGPQYAVTGQKLLSVFPNKPKSTPVLRLDNKYIYNELDKINNIRNRIAHHEPICFEIGSPFKSVLYVNNEYQRILKLFDWMGINGDDLLFGVDHVLSICHRIMAI